MNWLWRALTTFAHRVRTSLRYRLVFLMALTIVASAAVSGVGTYQAARASQYHQLDIELVSIAERAAVQLAADFPGSTITSVGALETDDVLVAIVGANRTPTTLPGATNVTIIITSAEIAVARIQTGFSARDGESSAGLHYRIVAVPFIDSATGDAYALVIGRVLGPTWAGLTELGAIQWIIGTIAVLASIIAAVFVAATTLHPIRELTTVVSGITSTDQLATIEVRGTSEVSDLERSFNVMMETLSASRAQQDRLIADAGHELRTPLTSLRTNIELLIADETAEMLPVGTRSEILSDVAAQLGEFTSLVNDLVVLSRGGDSPANLITTDFSEVVRRAVARAQRRGPSMIFDVTLAPVYVMGDAVTLERAVTNLLDNAVKFSPSGSTITVSLNSSGLVITDQGPGVSAKDIPHIFERFYRSDSSRNTPGTGLGLSIVEHTITAHGGTVSVTSPASGGARFTVLLPEVEPEEE